MNPQLTACSRIIDEASLWYNSSSDSSSASTQSNPSSEAVDPATSAETRNAVVLICDDNLDMRQYAINVLSKHFTCYGFGNGEDVHRWLSKAHNHADLLVTDRMMPRMDVSRTSHGYWQIAEKCTGHDLTPQPSERTFLRPHAYYHPVRSSF